MGEEVVTDSDGVVRFNLGAHRGCQALPGACELADEGALDRVATGGLLGPASDDLLCCLVREGTWMRKRPLLVWCPSVGPFA